jgi:hypothetical protein
VRAARVRRIVRVVRVRPRVRLVPDLPVLHWVDVAEARAQPADARLIHVLAFRSVSRSAGCKPPVRCRCSTGSRDPSRVGVAIRSEPVAANATRRRPRRMQAGSGARGVPEIA